MNSTRVRRPGSPESPCWPAAGTYFPVATRWVPSSLCPQLATVIYVDSPAGAGLSYSMRPETDYHTNDERTTQDLVTFLEVGRPTGLAGSFAAPVYWGSTAERQRDERKHWACGERG